MPTLAELQRNSFSSAQITQESDRGEVLVADSRAQLSPSQQVEQKLRGSLGARPQSVFAALTRRVPKPR